MRLFKMLKNRKRKFKTWTRDGYINGSYKIPVIDIISQYIMLNLLNMDYYWVRGWGIGWSKIHTLESILGEPDSEQA